MVRDEDEPGRCCLCGDLLFDAPGQTLTLPAYALEAGDPAFAAGAVGPCWQSALIASSWGAHWAERLATHFAARGMIARPRDGAWRAFRSPNLPEIVLIRDDGRCFDVRLDAPRRATSDGLVIAAPTRDRTVWLGSERRALTAEIQGRLKRDGQYPLSELVDAFGVAHRLTEPTALAGARLIYSAEEAIYWTADAVCALVSQTLLLPHETARLIEAEPDQGPPAWLTSEDGAK